MFKVAVFVGSTRESSSNMKLAKALAKLSAGRLEFSFCRYCLAAVL
jgi:chromate reductase